jgi:hypothetical protein
MQLRHSTVLLQLRFVRFVICVIVRPFVFVRVFARPTRLLATLHLPLHRVCPTLSRPPVPPCLGPYRH